MATKLISPPDQRFACRDCPARCCRLPWRIHLRGGESERLLADAWVRERAGEEGAAVIARGILPMREVDRRLQCALLDEDGLCGLQKRGGHGAIPRACQAFPFGFVRDEGGAVVAQLSQLCPSIRDDYGEPVDRQLRAKLQQVGEVGGMADEMVTLGGVVLSRSQYLRVARRWEAALASDGSPAAVLAGLHDWMSAFEAALPARVERATDAAVQAASDQADTAAQAEPLSPRRSPSSQARWLFAYLLGSLCHPSRLRRSHRIGARPSWLEALRSLGNKLAWLLGRGTVDMLFVPRPFKLQRVPTVARFLTSEEGSLVRDYLRRVIQRRGIFAWGTRPMMDVVLDLSLATTVISRFARCRAAAEARVKVTPEDVREGISVAEMLILNHASVGDEGGVMARVRWHMLANRASFREMLATEA